MDEPDLDDVTEISSEPLLDRPPPAGRASRPVMPATPTAPPVRVAFPQAPVLPPGYGHDHRPSYPAGPELSQGPDDVMRVASLASLTLDKGKPRPAAGPRFTKLPWILLAVFVVGGGYYHYVTVRDASSTTASAPLAQTQAAGPAKPTAPSGRSLQATGYIAARAPIVLSASMSGRVDEVTVDNGQQITKGQILARVADKQIRAELGLARARVRDAQRAHQRTRMLVKAQAATPADLERAVGQVEIARAEMSVIAQKLEETRIRSPIDGTVLEVLARPGETLTVGPGEGAGVLRIANLSALVAEVDVAEAELKSVFVGQEAEVIVDAQGGATHAGAVREIAEQADRTRGTVLVKVDITTTPESNLRPGMAIQVRFKPKSSPAPAP